MTAAVPQEDFDRAYNAGEAQLLSLTLLADLETPVSAFIKLTDGQRYRCLFESVEGGKTIGRYSFIGMKPDVIWRCKDGKAEINRQARARPDEFEPVAENALASLRALIDESRIELPEGCPPMASALIGYFGYDMIRLFERIPAINPDVLEVPDSLFLRPTIVAVFDRLEDRITVFTPVWPGGKLDSRRAYEEAQIRLNEVAADFERSLHDRRMPLVGTPIELPEPKANMPREAYHAMVKRAKEYILAGDIFQVVPSQRFALPFALPPLSLYRSLRRLNPSPFLFLLELDGLGIVGSSPEILVRLRGRQVTIRPIAGTRRRGKTTEEDRALAEDLLSDPKELAEHLMLLDLGRNDVGRVAEIGSVKVTERNSVEYYSHVMHIVSNVVGKIDCSRDAVDALAAGFPAGTVSGAPKVRAMEIIEELEPERRGIYAGAVGYFGAGGDMDTCIALRTAVIKDGTMYVQAGGGVVADSDPESEYQESCNKARALLRAAEEAVAFAHRRG